MFLRCDKGFCSEGAYANADQCMCPKDGSLASRPCCSINANRAGGLCPPHVYRTDRRSEYCAPGCQNLVRQLGVQASTEGGSCFDNAHKLVHDHRLATRKQTQQEITEYIEIFNNQQRTKTRLDYPSAAAFCAALLVWSSRWRSHGFRPPSVLAKVCHY